MNPHVPLKPYQKDFHYSYAFGVFPTLELLQQVPGRVLKVIWHSSGADNDGVRKIHALCARHQIVIEQQDNAVDKLARRGDTYAIGVFEKAESSLADDANHVVLVEPGDMGNLGTIIRTMLAFGVCDLALIPPAADVYDPRVVRASMGAIFQLRLKQFASFEHYWTRHPHQHLYPFLTDAATALPDVTFKPPHALIFGSESAGLLDSFHHVGTPVAIPQRPAVDSLNLAVSAGIALYAAASSASPR